MAEEDLPSREKRHDGWGNQERDGAGDAAGVPGFPRRAAVNGRAFARLSQQADCILQRGVLGLIIVLRVQVLDLSVGEIQLRLG